MFQKNLTVAGRLAIGFGTLLMLMTVLALIGISRLQAVGNMAKILTDQDRLLAYAVTNTESLTRANVLALMEIAIDSKSRRSEQLRSQVSANRKKIEAALASLAANADLAPHKPLLDDISRARSPLLDCTEL